jgi:hypothetical protein
MNNDPKPQSPPPESENPEPKSDLDMDWYQRMEQRVPTSDWINELDLKLEQEKSDTWFAALVDKPNGEPIDRRTAVNVHPWGN